MSELVASTKKQIKRIIPYAKSIWIKVEKDHQFYRSQINLKVPGNILHVKKKAATIGEAMELSTLAIKKQIKKMKEKRQGKFLAKKNKNSNLDTH